jgi:hypothetical protein
MACAATRVPTAGSASSAGQSSRTIGSIASSNSRLSIVSCLTRDAVLRRELRGGVLRVNCGIRAKMHAPIDELTEGEAAEFFAEIGRGGDDQCFEDVDPGDSANFAESRAR